MSVFFSYAASTSLPHIFFIPNSFPLPLFPFLSSFSFFLLSLLPPLLTLCFINSLAFLVDLFVSLAVSDSPLHPLLSITAGLNHLSRCASTLSHLSFFSLLHPPTTIWSCLSRYLPCEPIFTRLASPFRFLFSQFSRVFNPGCRRSVRSLKSSPALWLIYRVARSSRSLAKISSWVIGIMSQRSWVRVHTVLSGRYSQVLCLPSLQVEC